MGVFKHGFNRIGMAGTLKRRFYDRWVNMRTRCYNRKRVDWKNYGMRGIIICDRWKDFSNFRDDMYESFLQHINRYGMKNTTLDRINYDKGYSPDNCRWATKLTQANNQRTNVTFDYGGNKLTVAQIARAEGRNYYTIYSRLVKSNIPLARPYRKSRQIQ